jgi:hypothetical protein
MDYDVAATGLHTPPPAASLVTYRPSISVRNNGRFSDIASGTISAYKDGLRVYFSPVTSPAIAPGETGLATAANDWTPETQGDYIFIGYVTSPMDQVEPNNNLAPVTIHVGPEPPTPPPTVLPHHAQHEEGGSDVISLDGLPGQLADPQTPLPHASSHQAAGADQLNVAGLAGILGEPQTPTAHGNEHHSTDFASMAELTNHAGATVVHSAADNLANRETSGPDSGLVVATQLASGSEPGGTPQTRFLALDRIWRAAAGTAASLGINTEPVQITPTVGGSLCNLDIPVAWISEGMQFLIKLCGYLHTIASPGATLELSLWLGQDQLGDITIDAGQTSDRDFTANADILGGLTDKARGAISWLSSGPLPGSTELKQSNENTLNGLPTSDTSLYIRAEFSNANPDSFIQLSSGFIRALHKP